MAKKNDSKNKSRKSCPITAAKLQDHVDYKNVALLQNFITERGKILGRRTTGVTRVMQNRLSLAIKRARFLALMPIVSSKSDR